MGGCVLPFGFFAGLMQGDGRPYPVDNDEAKKLALSLQRQVPGALLEQGGEISHKLSGRLGNGLIGNWRAATDLTANRVGFIVANDFPTAAKGIATEGASLSSMSVKERLRDLLAYAVSEQYFQVRRHLGLQIRSEATA